MTTTTSSAAVGADRAPIELVTDCEARPEDGVFPSQGLRQAIEQGWIRSGPYRISPAAIQPASIDLRLGDFAWALRCSFLPDVGSTVEAKVGDVAFQRVDLRDGATLERDRPYLVPLVEELHLPPWVRAKANPKSSTGRLDIFSRVITDRTPRFDEVTPGYRGRLYMELVPRTFAVHVKSGMSLNQLRLTAGESRVTDDDLRHVHAERPLVYIGGRPIRDPELSQGGLFLGVDLSGGSDAIVGYRAKRNSNVISLDKVREYRWRDYWDPVHPERGGRIVLEPEAFYLLLSTEGACIPPEYAAEMSAYSAAGELRTHYAGFFDPGFGYDPLGVRHGSRAALEVRAHDVPFMIEHGNPLCKLAFERMSERPDRLYGRQLGSNYQGQVSMLSKHFTDQTAGLEDEELAPAPANEPAHTARLFDCDSPQ